MLIWLVSIKFLFCFRLSLQFSFNIGKKTFYIPPNPFVIEFCRQLGLFAWLGNLLGKFKLPCDGGPDTEGLYEGYVIDLRNCTGTCPNGILCPCDTPGVGNPCGGCSPFCIKLRLVGAFEDNNSCLEALNNWRCCVKTNLAETRNVIRRVFNDAWVLGTAYLFQFKYKKRVNRITGSVRKEKFCGPGSDNLNGDSYKHNKCCVDTKNSNECDRCLVRGPGSTKTDNIYDGVDNYHKGWHNSATANKETGATDIDDLIYCNALMSTKIVSLGRIEMCDETLEQIQNSLYVNQALTEYIQTPSYYTGTFYEMGWDKNMWINSLKESSYEDPTEVIKYLAGLKNCQLNNMFYEGELLSGKSCHEFEMKDFEFFFTKEISKIYNDVTLSTSTNGQEVFNPISISNTIAQSVQIDNNQQANGGFEVVADIANRFSPCGGSGNCYPGTQWNPTNITPGYEDLSNNPSAFDSIIDPNNRNNINTRSNIPYYYFGINPGKTAINKLKKDFFIQK